MTTIDIHTMHRRRQRASAVLAGAAVCIAFGAASAALAAALGYGDEGSQAGTAGAKVRFYVGPKNPYGEFAKRPFQGWHYVLGNPGEAGRLNWDSTFEPGPMEVDAAHPRWPVNVHFEIEVSAYPSHTRGGIANFSRAARFHWALPTAVGMHPAAGPFMTAPPARAPEAPTAALAVLGLVLLTPLRRRWQQGT